MQGAYSKNKKYQLPRPYGLKPKDNKLPRAYFTTPMKKMMGYIVFMFLIGCFIYLFGPKRETSREDVHLSLESPDGSVVEADNFVNTLASSKKNGKLSVDEVVDESISGEAVQEGLLLALAALAG